jgi:hypothetical protein
MNLEQESVFEDHVAQIKYNLVERFPDHHIDTIDKSARDWATIQEKDPSII